MTKFNKFSRRKFLAGIAVAAGSTLVPNDLLAAPLPAGLPQQPELIPERLILSLTADPAHSQAVTWRTGKAIASVRAQIAPASANPDFERAALAVTASVATANVPSDKIVGEYAAQFNGLTPNTRYSYRVGDGTTWSEWNSFQTASDKPEAFRFLYLGDEQNNIKSLWSRSIRAAYSKAPDARFIVHAGDLLAEGYDDRLWGEWSDAMGFISAVMPSLPTPGNHDLHQAPGKPYSKEVLSVSPLWRQHFALPMNGPKGVDELNEQAYYIDYQGVRFISLDVNVYSNEAFVESAKKRVGDQQLAWLEQLLRENPNRWTVVVQHQPMYPIAKGRDYVEMRNALLPLYDKYHVDLVLQGHDHTYARTHKLVAGKVVSPSQPGTIYAISVSGPKMYEIEDTFAPLRARTLAHTQAFQVIDVDGGKLTYNAYAIEGELIDHFELLK
jgi:Calcineurin-like phosphoesterase/Purple acid Phosphatase, N-terminal domain